MTNDKRVFATLTKNYGVLLTKNKNRSKTI